MLIGPAAGRGSMERDGAERRASRFAASGAETDVFVNRLLSLPTAPPDFYVAEPRRSQQILCRGHHDAVALVYKKKIAGNFYRERHYLHVRR